MQLEALKVFCDVARFRSFSQAASANNLTQSSVSQIVHQLERRLGVRLVDRSVRPLQLTDLGRRYYDGCKTLIEQYFELEASIRNGEARIIPTVQVAAIYSVGLSDMGQYIGRFKTAQPQAEVHVEYLHPDRVYEKALDGTADFGLVSFPRKLRELAVLPWRDEEMVLACSPNHRLAEQKAIKPAQLDGERFVAFDKGLVIRREVDRFLREQEVAVEVACEFDNIENIKQAVEVGAGVALLPEPTLRREAKAGTLAALPLAGCRLVRPLGIIYRRQHKPHATAMRFIELLQGQAHGSHPVSLSKRRNGSHRARNGSIPASK